MMQRLQDAKSTMWMWNGMRRLQSFTEKYPIWEGIRMGNEVLKRGLNQDDVLYADDEKVIAVNIPECEAIRAVVAEDYPEQIARLCYEVGNTHTSMFRGEDGFTFYMPCHEALLKKLLQIYGVTAEKVQVRFDFSKALSSSVNNHHH